MHARAKWYGWIRDLSLERPWSWVMIEATGRETYQRCLEELDRLYPSDEPPPSAGSKTKVAIPAGQTPSGKLD